MVLLFIIMSPDPFFFTSFSFREHYSATVRNILMILGRIEQVNTECHIQE